jgi:hypothetical protein
MTVIVTTAFEHDGRKFTAEGTWTPTPARCGFAPTGDVVVVCVLSRATGARMEPIEGGGLHRAASAAIRKAARKDS